VLLAFQRACLRTVQPRPGSIHFEQILDILLQPHVLESGFAFQPRSTGILHVDNHAAVHDC